MDSTARTQIITAAATAAGPRFTPEGALVADWEQRVRDCAVTIATMSNEKSSVARAIDALNNSRAFPATIISVKREESSKRGLVTMKAKPSQWHPDGIEQARTERTDSPEGLQMAQRLGALIGHKVMLFIEEQVAEKTGKKVRIITNVVDEGLAEAVAV